MTKTILFMCLPTSAYGFSSCPFSIRTTPPDAHSSQPKPIVTAIFSHTSKPCGNNHNLSIFRGS